MTQALAHRWRFFRAGGFDQVQLETPADLAALRSLDQKLWASLACPVTVSYTHLPGEGVVLRAGVAFSQPFGSVLADDLGEGYRLAQRLDDRIQPRVADLVIEHHLPLVAGDGADIQRPRAGLLAVRLLGAQVEMCIRDSNQAVASQRAQIEQVATAMNQMSATAQEVARSAAAAVGSAQSVNQETVSGRALVEQQVGACLLYTSPSRRNRVWSALTLSPSCTCQCTATRGSS